MQTKTCTKCGEAKPISEYYKQKHGKYGVRSRCISCTLQENKEWDTKNPTQRAAISLRWQVNNPDKNREKSRAWAEANKLKKKLYYEQNKKRILTYSSTWAKSNRDRLNVRDRNRRARIRNAEGTHTAQDIQSQLETQDGYCAYCGVDLESTGYHTEHIRPLNKGGRNDIINLVCTCPTCNTSKQDKTLPEWFDYLDAVNQLTDTLATNIIFVHEQWIKAHSDDNGQISLFD